MQTKTISHPALKNKPCVTARNGAKETREPVWTGKDADAATTALKRAISANGGIRPAARALKLDAAQVKLIADGKRQPTRQVFEVLHIPPSQERVTRPVAQRPTIRMIQDMGPADITAAFANRQELPPLPAEHLAMSDDDYLAMLLKGAK